MKILQVITSLQIGGAEKLIIDMVPLFRKEGHQVDVLLFDGVETPFKKQLEELGIRILSFNVKGSVYNPVYIFNLVPIIKQYDIVHTHNTVCQYFAAMAKTFSLCKRTKFVTTEHSTNNRRRKSVYWKLSDRFMYHKYDAIVAISEKVSNLLKIHISDLMIQVIHNGINIEAYRQVTPLSKENFVPSGSVLVTMVSRFGEAKDQETLVRALSLLPVNYYVLLVGDGDATLMQRCKELVLNLKLDERVIFTGIRSDIPSILKVADIVVMSSHWEGFGLAAVEGMAAGKPVVATDVPGLAEVVQEAGILFPHGEAKALADIILRLEEEPAYYRQIADRCMRRASGYDIRKTVDRYLQLYQSLL
jgi:hypothetical protein